MYTIIGGDGREYGPVTAEQVRSWMAGGRANLETRMKLVGDETWKTIADFPEITGAAPAFSTSAATPGGPPGTPPSSLVVPGSVATPFFAPAGRLDIISCYERSWALLKANFWPLIGVSLLMTLSSSSIIYLHLQGLTLVSPLFGAVIGAGVYYYFLLKIRGRPTTVADAFSGFTRGFLNLLVAGLLISVFVTVGMVCLLLPGIYLLVAYPFAYLLIVDKRLGFWEAMETSRRTITPQWWRMFGLLLLAIPFIILGFAVFIVGIFVAMPLVIGAVAYAYEDLCAARK